jgi:hypothetical protein
MGLRAMLVAAALGLAAGGSHAQDAEVRMLVQSSPLAGFRYYEGKALWNEMKVGDALALVREAGNPHDANAVRVEWRGHRLGYVPRSENRSVAQHIDRGGRVEARISKLQKHPNAWQRVEFEIFVRL